MTEREFKQVERGDILIIDQYTHTKDRFRVNPPMRGKSRIKVSAKDSYSKTIDDVKGWTWDYRDLSLSKSSRVTATATIRPI